MYFKHRSSPKLKMFVVLTADKGIELILDSIRSHMHPILHICLLKFWTKNLHLWGFSLIFGLLWYYYGHLRLIPFWLCTTTILHVLAFMNMREYVLQKRSLFEESFKLFLYIILNSSKFQYKWLDRTDYLRWYCDKVRFIFPAFNRKLILDDHLISLKVLSSCMLQEYSVLGITVSLFFTKEI